MIDRIRQGFNYIYGVYNEKDDRLAKATLTDKEYEIFIEMNNYDKVHSIEVLKMLLEDDKLCYKKEYKKLALLHDCGKEKAGLIRRSKKVIIGDKKLEAHSERSYEMLKDTNLKVAKLARRHHEKDVPGDLKRFQYIDDHC